MARRAPAKFLKLPTPQRPSSIMNRCARLRFLHVLRVYFPFFRGLRIYGNSVPRLRPATARRRMSDRYPNLRNSRRQPHQRPAIESPKPFKLAPRKFGCGYHAIGSEFCALLRLTLKSQCVVNAVTQLGGPSCSLLWNVTFYYL